MIEPVMLSQSATFQVFHPPVRGRIAERRPAHSAPARQQSGAGRSVWRGLCVVQLSAAFLGIVAMHAVILQTDANCRSLAITHAKLLQEHAQLARTVAATQAASARLRAPDEIAKTVKMFGLVPEGSQPVVNLTTDVHAGPMH